MPETVRQARSAPDCRAPQVTGGTHLLSITSLLTMPYQFAILAWAALTFALLSDVTAGATTPMGPKERYVHIRTLQRTMQGKVDLGMDRTTGNIVALKGSQRFAVDHMTTLNGLHVVENPLQERRVLETLNCPGHPNVIRLVDSFEDGRYYWMVLEFASQGDILDLINADGRGHLDEASAAKYFLQLLRALEYIHGKRICHLDVSLENILLDEHRNIKLADYGVALEFDPDRPFPECSPQTRPGKPGYASPEIMECKLPFIGPQADLYSAGIVLFVMLFGCYPYEKPDTLTDPGFRLVRNGQLAELVHALNKSPSKHAVELLSGLLCPAESRLSLPQVLQHPWIAQIGVSQGAP